MRREHALKHDAFNQYSLPHTMCIIVYRPLPNSQRKSHITIWYIDGVVMHIDIAFTRVSLYLPGAVLYRVP